MSYAQRIEGNPRPVETARPLAIGAARFHSEFDCLAPPHWTGAILIAQLFKYFDMEVCGWSEKKTQVECIGSYPDRRKWRVTK